MKIIACSILIMACQIQGAGFFIKDKSEIDALRNLVARKKTMGTKKKVTQPKLNKDAIDESSKKKKCPCTQATCSKILRKLNKINKKLAWEHVILAKDITPNGLIIDQPGVYCLAENVLFAPLVADTPAITIASDDVVLHLNGHTIRKALGAVTGINGIEVAGRSNVSIDGGSVLDFNLWGIQINEGSSYVNLSQLNLLRNGAESTFGGGIALFSEIGNAAHDIILDHVNASDNIWVGLLIAGGDKVTIRNCIFNNNKGTVLPVVGDSTWGALITTLVTVSTCSNIDFIDSEASGNTGTGGAIGFEPVSIPVFGLPFIENVNFVRCVANSNKGGGGTGLQEGEGFVFAGSRNCVVDNCIAQGNGSLATGPSGTAGRDASIGFGVTFAGENISFINCLAQGNAGDGDVSAGFRASRSRNITFTNCTASGNNNNAVGGEAWGFTTDTNIGNPTAFDEPVNRSFIFDSCVAESNLASNGLGGGFKFLSQVSSILTKSTSQTNAIGILVGDPTCCGVANDCNLLDSSCGVTVNCCPSQNNEISNNNIVGNSQFGIQDLSQANNAYLGNVARGNGAAGNNFVGSIFPSPITCQNPVGCVSAATTPVVLWVIPGAPCAVDTNCVAVTDLDNKDIRP